LLLPAFTPCCLYARHNTVMPLLFERQLTRSSLRLRCRCQLGLPPAFLLVTTNGRCLLVFTVAAMAMLRGCHTLLIPPLFPRLLISPFRLAHHFHQFGLPVDTIISRIPSSPLLNNMNACHHGLTPRPLMVIDWSRRRACVCLLRHYDIWCCAPDDAAATLMPDADDDDAASRAASAAMLDADADAADVADALLVVKDAKRCWCRDKTERSLARWCRRKMMHALRLRARYFDDAAPAAIRDKERCADDALTFAVAADICRRERWWWCDMRCFTMMPPAERDDYDDDDDDDIAAMMPWYDDAARCAILWWCYALRCQPVDDADYVPADTFCRAFTIWCLMFMLLFAAFWCHFELLAYWCWAMMMMFTMPWLFIIWWTFAAITLMIIMFICLFIYEMMPRRWYYVWCFWLSMLDDDATR